MDQVGGWPQTGQKVPKKRPFLAVFSLLFWGLAANHLFEPWKLRKLRKLRKLYFRSQSRVCCKPQFRTLETPETPETQKPDFSVVSEPWFDRKQGVRPQKLKKMAKIFCCRIGVFFTSQLFQKTSQKIRRCRNGNSKSEFQVLNRSSKCLLVAPCNENPTKTA